MTMKLIKHAFLYLLLSLPTLAVAADDVFYCEAGATCGCGFVLGDVNGILFRTVEPLGGAFLKYKFNGHYELRLQMDGGYLGVSADKESRVRTGYFGAQVVGEFNFFNYGAPRWEAYRSWVTPTVIAGIGMIGFKGHVAATVPLGLGVKFKLSNRINVGAYWMVSKVFSDAVDYVDDPIGLNRGFWNNRDWYSTAQIYLSVNFYKICAPCRNGVRVRKEYRHE